MVPQQSQLLVNLDKNDILSDLVRLGIFATKVFNFIGRYKKLSIMFIVCIDKDHVEFSIKRILDFSVRSENLKPLNSVV